jgi:hypothetical protein
MPVSDAPRAPTRRCRGCNKPFFPRRPSERFCRACWAIRRSGLAPGWIAARVAQIASDVDAAIFHDDELERR